MTKDCVHDENEERSLDQELAIAQRALYVDDDLEHCRFHLAAAFFSGPNDARCADLCSEWFARGPDLDQVLNREDPWIGDVLLGAQTRARMGERALAIESTLVALAAGAPTECVFWLETWIRGPLPAPVLSTARIASALARIDRDDCDPELWPALDRWLDRVDPLVEWQSAEIVLRVRCKRWAGHLDAALALAEGLYRAAPGFWGATAVAACHRDLGHAEPSIAASRRAAEHDPKNGFVWLDIGDQALDPLEDYGQASDAYRRARELGAKPIYAQLSEAAAMYLHRPSPQTRAAFERLAEAHRDDPRVATLRWYTDAWISYVPAAREACLNLLERSQSSANALVSIRLSAPEAPCAQFHLQQSLASNEPAVTLTIDRIPHPDPRVGEPRLAAFRWLGNTVVANAQRPVNAPWDQVAALARSPFRPAAWLTQARASESPSTLTLLAMLPFPSDQDDIDPVHWRRLWVAACVFMIGAQPKVGWPDLVSLVRAPIDWPSEAALVCLAALVVESPERERELMTLIDQQRARLPDAGDYCLRYGIVAALRLLGEVELPERPLFSRIWSRWFG